MNASKSVYLLSIVLVGCASVEKFEQGLTRMMGEKESVAFNVLGYPSAKQQYGSDTVYYWTVSRSGTVFVPQTSTTSGTVGGSPVYGTTTYNQAIPVNYSCQIKLVANSSGYLKQWEYSGDYAGCKNYMDKVTYYYEP
ncbi:hypothetical protein U2G60_001614 [Vibrio fluvialis]|nr:hypothetical protein [Vibrio fluvialis]MBY7926321.1 hypothetical protein [Vibrio fluvialis]MBY8308911.1 hypothetical protein [Vibrio fluvialis]